MNFSQNEENEETGIELTPLIDVVFLLLLFFMISTTFNKDTALEINLPEAESESLNESNPVEIQVSADERYAISSGDGASPKALTNANRSTLVSALKEMEEIDKRQLIIRADRKAPHEAVIRVLDVAQQLGISNISFATVVER